MAYPLFPTDLHQALQDRRCHRALRHALVSRVFIDRRNGAHEATPGKWLTERVDGFGRRADPTEEAAVQHHIGPTL